jgi:TonB-linked SusC/RagA family outer membrane protein
MKKLLKGGLIPFLLLWAGVSMAQNRTITGKVLDDVNAPVAGASVTVKNSTSGTTTNDKGEFTLTVAPSANTLVISSLGFVTREVGISGNTVSVSLAKSVSALDEVVVVGYGTQKKVNVSGAIASVRSKDLENVPNGRIEQALQGRVSGVTVLQNSGQPGSSSTIRVRGITTFNNNEPLWVVDGVVVDAGGIGYLNQSDIESIEVLKDAASAAIYGTRAAAGVILVTTKKGKSGKMTVAYNGFYGTSAPARMLDLTNATQYATLINEASVAGGGAIIYPDVSTLGVGTDWQKAIFNDHATRYLHEISLSGGNEKSTYYMSAGLQNQNGIVATDISKYAKKNFRLNSTHKIGQYFTFGQTLGYTYQKSTGLGNTNSEFGGPLSSAVNLDPITKLLITDPAQVTAFNAIWGSAPVVRDANGNPYGISSAVGQEMTNPLAYIQTRLGQYNWSDDFVGNAYLEAQPIAGLKIRSTVGVKKAYWGDYGFTPVYTLSSTVANASNRLARSENRVLNWNVENTITYNRKFGDHDLTVLVGQGAYVENIGSSINQYFQNLPITSYTQASFNFGANLPFRDGYTSDMTQHKISSLFGRLNYSYQDKYTLTGIVRRDGSTRFGSNNKYGTFPSFSAGWNIDRESFFPSNNTVKNLKIRGGYGVVGNDGIPDFRYLATINNGFNYTIGSAGAVTTGYAPRTLENPDLKWERTASTDIGFDATVFNNFNFVFNWYSKKTTGILRQNVIPGYVGVSEDPWANIADMTNTGLEFELGYHKKIGDLNLSVNGNFSTLKNTVNKVAADTNFVGGGASFQSMGTITRVQVGQSYNSFFGYQRLGIFQTMAEVTGYVNKAGNPIQPKARPGDIKWADLNGDGEISKDDKDKTFLGSNIPKYTFGFTFNLEYKGFDMMVFAQGAGGNKIFQGLRRLDIISSNFSINATSRWTGPGTSNDYPRLASGDPSENRNFANMSSLYLEDGDYLRLKVLQLGYTLPTRLLGKTGLSKVRFYVTAENLLTLTKYTGYDPEVGGGVFGVDKGQYPQARAFMGGVQLQF